jgi:uncharacterized coiled-coil protein SlyX
MDQLANQLGAETATALATFLTEQRQHVEQLERQINTLQQQLQDRDDEAQQLAAAIVQNIPAPVINIPPPPPATSRPPKAADPEVFSGDRKKADSFLRAVSLNIAIQPRAFPDDQTRILYALSWMQGGSAGEWAANHTRTMLEGHHNPFTSWDDFRHRFEAAFGDSDRQAQSRQSLHDLRMTRTMTAEEYTAAFEALAGRTGFNDAALMDAYERGLQRGVVEKIHLDDLPQTLQEWKDKAIRVDKLWRRFQEQHSTTANRDMRTMTPRAPASRPPIPPRPSPHSNPTPTFEPMDVDSTRRQGPPQRTPRLCYNCDKPGHLARDCHEPPRSRSLRAVTHEDIEMMVRTALAKTQARTEGSQEDGVAKDF